jgi:Oxidoreductase molybdopterin binding domain
VFQFSVRATNVGMLCLVLSASITGLGAFINGGFSGRWIVWLHCVAALALVFLLIWKRRVIAGSLRRHGLGIWALPSLALLAILALSLASGLLWSTAGLPSLAGESGLTLHASISLALALLLLPHARAGWPRLSSRASAGRRALLSAGILGLAGLALWRGSELASAAAGLSGARRRFTGSREAASFTGNYFPANSWLLDDPRPIELTNFRLTIKGNTRRPLSLTLDDLTLSSSLRATLDCTGGWYTEQDWQGILLEDLLDRSQILPGTRSITVHSATGYWRRFPYSHANRLLLALKVGGEDLEHAHGAPIRLVAPGRRGYDWVKWVTVIELSSIPAWLNWPLPVS